jgi:hypothetical protein
MPPQTSQGNVTVYYDLLQQIIEDFEALVSQFDGAISDYGGDGNDHHCLTLRRARDAAVRGTDLARLLATEAKR